LVCDGFAAWQIAWKAAKEPAVSTCGKEYGHKGVAGQNIMVLVTSTAENGTHRTKMVAVVCRGIRNNLPLPLTLREEHRLRVFENRVLKRIFGPRRDEVTRVW
jgi:hypothetical protein